VVVLPLPVGPVTKRIPSGERASVRNRARTSAGKPSRSRPTSGLESRTRRTASSPKGPGTTETRKSIGRLPRPVLVGRHDATVLRLPALGEVHLGQHLQARDDLFNVAAADRRSDLDELAVLAEPDVDVFFVTLDVQIAGADRNGVSEQLRDEAWNGRVGLEGQRCSAADGQALMPLPALFCLRVAEAHVERLVDLEVVEADGANGPSEDPLDHDHELDVLRVQHPHGDRAARPRVDHPEHHHVAPAAKRRVEQPDRARIDLELAQLSEAMRGQHGVRCYVRGSRTRRCRSRR
jgi:hypothetical protein